MTDTWTIILVVSGITLSGVGGATWFLDRDIDKLTLADVKFTGDIDKLHDEHKDFIRAITNLENLIGSVKNIDGNIKNIQKDISDMKAVIKVLNATQDTQ